MAQGLVKVQKNKNITLPTWLMRRFHLAPGDYVRFQETREGVMMKPAALIDPTQAYFWTPEWQAGEAEAETDIRQGRVRKVKSVKALMKDLRE